MNSTAIDSVLTRLERNIRDIGRMLLENENHVAARVLINSSLTNLLRIREGIAPERYEAINEPLQQLASLLPSSDDPHDEIAIGDANQDSVVLQPAGAELSVSEEAYSFRAERIAQASGIYYFTLPTR